MTPATGRWRLPTSKFKVTLSYIRPCLEEGALTGYSSMVEVFFLSCVRTWIIAPKSQEERGGVRRNTKGHTRTDSEAGKREMVAEAKAGKEKGTRGDGSGDQQWVSGKVAVCWELGGKGHEVELGSQRSTSVRS